VSVGVLKIDPAAAVPIVELAVFKAPGRAAEGDFRLLDAGEDSVELAVADMESVVMALELRVFVEQDVSDLLTRTGAK